MEKAKGCSYMVVLDGCHRWSSSPRIVAPRGISLSFDEDGAQMAHTFGSDREAIESMKMVIQTYERKHN